MEVRLLRLTFNSYVETTLKRDLNNITDAHKLREMPRLLRLVASQAANLFIPANISKRHHASSRNGRGLSPCSKQCSWSDACPRGPWHRQEGDSPPKAYLADTGLLLHLLGANEKRLANDDQVTGKALENFVAMEVLRHAEWSEQTPQLFHYRQGRDEVDLVLKDRAATLRRSKSRRAPPCGIRIGALARLRDARSESFRSGVLLYTGETTV